MGFYDPFTGSNNVVSVDNGTGTFGGAINTFIKGNGAAQWIDAVGEFQSLIEAALVDAYGWCFNRNDKGLPFLVVLFCYE